MAVCGGTPAGIHLPAGHHGGTLRPARGGERQEGEGAVQGEATFISLSFHIFEEQKE